MEVILYVLIVALFLGFIYIGVILIISAIQILRGQETLLRAPAESLRPFIYPTVLFRLLFGERKGVIYYYLISGVGLIIGSVLAIYLFLR